MLRYYKLFDMLNRMDKNKSYLLEIISSKTIAKLSKGENVNTDIIEKICDFLGCQPGDIMEHVEKSIETTTGKEIEYADHTLTSQEPFKPDNDYNVYPSDIDSQYEEGYKKRII